MKIAKRCLGLLVLLVAMVAAVGGIWTAIQNRQAGPVLVSPSEEALCTASTMLQAVSDGDYELAGSLILGQPKLGVDREAEGEVGKLIWKAYQDSLEFTPQGDSFATASGIAQKYSVRYLDIDSVTTNLRDRSQKMLEERVAGADDMSDVYDENNEYREDVVMDVLLDATGQAIAEDAVYKEVTFAVNLIFRDGKWWVVSDSQLLSAISGSLVG